MFNQYHTAQYQGNQPGHDNALRSDSSQPSFAASSVASQYRSGSQQRFQPTGYVQSFYNQQQNQQQNQSFQQRPQQVQFQQAGFGAASFGQSGGQQQSYQMANYRGNQPNHDNYLRADSQQPSQMGFASQQQPQQGFGINQSYHAANYQGNQPNHDNYLRSDSQQPSQFGSAGSFGMGQQQQQFNSGFQNTQQYHAANYRGNQPNHDNYLRADSQQPSQANAAFSNMRNNFSNQSFIR